MARARLLDACRTAKEALTGASRKLVVDFGTALDGVEGATLETSAVNAACEPLVERTLELLERIFDRVRERGIDPSNPRELGGVYLVGGATAFPLVTRTLRDRYKKKVLVAPKAHASTAVGLAMAGFRPVVEMQFDAFAYPAFEQLISHVARMRNRTRGAMPLPITIRVPYGGGIGGVEHHSDSSEAYYIATPGLHVVTPATVADAYGLLRAAIASDDPVVFLEPKRLYWSKDTWNPEEPRSVEPIGRAVVRRAGRSATLITYGPSVPVCLEAAEAATAEGWDLEVVDLRSLVPFDDETVAASVRRTGRAVVVHESGSYGGPGGEIAARVTERCFHHLEAPVLRVAGFDIPYPPPMLERHHLPGVDRILDAVGRLQWEAEN